MYKQASNVCPAGAPRVKGRLDVNMLGMFGLPNVTGSLTGVERARDESEQVLCELEDLPLAPFPAAHPCDSGLGEVRGTKLYRDSKTFLRPGCVSVLFCGCVSVARLSV